MSLIFHILQWIFSIASFLGLVSFLYRVVLALVAMFRKDRSAAIALAVFVVGFGLAATCQRVRIGFWDWPDVDYQVEEAEEDPATESTETE